MVGIAALLRNALRGIAIAQRATVELITEFAIAFGVGIAQLHLVFRLATLPLFDALAAIVALRHDLCDALLAGLLVLLAAGVIPALLPLQFTGKLSLGLLARFLSRLLALLGLLLRWLLGLLLRMLFALLLAQFLARLAVIFVFAGILRAGARGCRAADGNHRHKQGNGKAAGSESAVHGVGSPRGATCSHPACAVGGSGHESKLRIFTVVGLT